MVNTEPTLEVSMRSPFFKIDLEFILLALIVFVLPVSLASESSHPAANAVGIASVAAQAAGEGVEIQLLNGTPLEPESGETARVRGVLGADRNVALRWQGRTAAAARKALTTCDTIATAQVTPTVIKFKTEFHYQIVQGNLAKLSVVLPANHALTRVEGEQIRDWQVNVAAGGGGVLTGKLAPDRSPEGNSSSVTTTVGRRPSAGGVQDESDIQILTVELIKPVEKSYLLKVFSEQAVESTPFSGPLTLPQPLSVDRESGSFTLFAEDTVVETVSLSGLRQINAPTGALAAYRFYGRPVSLAVGLRRIDPVIHVGDRVTARLEEARLLVSHTLKLTVENAGIYSLELSPLENFIPTDVRGEGVEDWKRADGKLIVNFASRVLGERRLDIQLEQAHPSFPD